MPRCARVKSFDSVYHIMVRSISDTPLYKCSDDKDKYLSLIKKYQDVYLFKVYAFCIMDSHTHIIIDGSGADISKVMHSINQCYAQYFNRKYKRHGHLFQDRFKSKIVYDDRYLIALSSYIHKNPSDITMYKDKIEYYKYSSLGIYLGIMDDTYDIVDTAFILNQFSKDSIAAKKQYIDFVHRSEEDEAEDNEFRHERAEYRSERVILVRNKKPCEVIEFVAAYTKQDRNTINVKYTKTTIEFKSLSALLLRGICDMKQKDICREFGNITQANASRLCLKGLKLINEKNEYKNIIKDFLREKAS